MEIQSPELFEIFWTSYQKKIGREAAVKAWNKLSHEDRQSAADNANDYARATPDKKYRPHPSTYLNQKRWTDDLADVVVSNVVTPSINKISEVGRIFNKVINEKIEIANGNGQRRID